MRTDLELLELAAKAAGIFEMLEWFEKENCFVKDNVVWNPLTDDGDALRLAVKLKLALDIQADLTAAERNLCSIENHNSDP